MSAYSQVAKEEPLLGAEPAEEAPAEPIVVSATRTVQVVAPADMEEGYRFGAIVDGEKVTVVVVSHDMILTSFLLLTTLVTQPAGGVGSGETFQAMVEESLEKNQGDIHNIPYGRWRDSLCNCCAYGCCQAQCCLTFWVPLLAFGQLLQRMNLDWLARPNTGSKNAFKVWAGIAAVMFVINMTSHSLYSQYHHVVIDQDGSVHYETDDAVLPSLLLLSNVAICVSIFFIVILTCLRKRVRDKYGIPAQCCGECEDCCCAYWCSACTICQIARHTADYHAYPAECCSETGLRFNAEV